MTKQCLTNKTHLHSVSWYQHRKSQRLWVTVTKTKCLLLCDVCLSFIFLLETDKWSTSNIMALNYCANQHFYGLQSICLLLPPKVTDGGKLFLNHNSKWEIIKKTSRTVKICFQRYWVVTIQKMSTGFQKQKNWECFPLLLRFWRDRRRAEISGWSDVSQEPAAFRLLTSDKLRVEPRMFPLTTHLCEPSAHW